MAANLSGSVACLINTSTYPSTDNGTDSPASNPRTLYLTEASTPSGVSGPTTSAAPLTFYPTPPKKTVVASYQNDSRNLINVSSCCRKILNDSYNYLL